MKNHLILYVSVSHSKMDDGPIFDGHQCIRFQYIPDLIDLDRLRGDFPLSQRQRLVKRWGAQVDGGEPHETNGGEGVLMSQDSEGPRFVDLGGSPK